MRYEKEGRRGKGGREEKEGEEDDDNEEMTKRKVIAYLRTRPEVRRV